MLILYFMLSFFNLGKIYEIELPTGEKTKVHYLTSNEINKIIEEDDWMSFSIKGLPITQQFLRNKNGNILNLNFEGGYGVLFEDENLFKKVYIVPISLVIIQSEDLKGIMYFQLLEKNEIDILLQKNTSEKIFENEEKSIIRFSNGKVLMYFLDGLGGELYNNYEEYCEIRRLEGWVEWK